jgi:DNA-binding beta-propeller fold protein YncE
MQYCKGQSGNGCVSKDGNLTTAGFGNLHGITIDRQNNILYVTEGYYDPFWSYNQIRRIDIVNNQVDTVAGAKAPGFVDGIGSSATFRSPYGIAIDPITSIIYVADSQNNAIRAVDGTSGLTWTLVGNGTAGHVDGPFKYALLNQPFDLLFDKVSNSLIVQVPPGVVIPPYVIPFFEFRNFNFTHTPRKL